MVAQKGASLGRTQAPLGTSVCTARDICRGKVRGPQRNENTAHGKINKDQEDIVLLVQLLHAVLNLEALYYIQGITNKCPAGSRELWRG